MSTLHVLVWFIPAAFIAGSVWLARREPRLAVLSFIAGIGLLAVCVVQVAT